MYKSISVECKYLGRSFYHMPLLPQLPFQVVLFYCWSRMSSSEIFLALTVQSEEDHLQTAGWLHLFLDPWQQSFHFYLLWLMESGAANQNIVVQHLIQTLHQVPYWWYPKMESPSFVENHSIAGALFLWVCLPAIRGLSGSTLTLAAMGKSKGNTDKPIDCKWAPLKTKRIKILGTHFNYNKELEEKMNFYNLNGLSQCPQFMEAKMAFASLKNSKL